MTHESSEILVTEVADGRIIGIAVRGKLDKSDYKTLVPALERQIQRHGKVRLVVELVDFHGWTAGALWEDLKFDLKHIADVERLAIVGNKAWERGMATFSIPFTKAEVRFFPDEEREAAHRWIARDLAA